MCSEDKHRRDWGLSLWFRDIQILRKSLACTPAWPVPIPCAIGLGTCAESGKCCSVFKNTYISVYETILAADVRHVVQ
jgi:hypothetical protein